MNKYERLKAELADEKKKEGKMKCFGQSMMPVMKSGSLLTFRAVDSYEVGDIVFCKVKGRYVDAHWITKKDARGRCMIANNKGFENGWTTQIYGKVVHVEEPK